MTEHENSPTRLSWVYLKHGLGHLNVAGGNSLNRNLELRNYSIGRTISELSEHAKLII
jgi:hypothetical protein